VRHTPKKAIGGNQKNEQLREKPLMRIINNLNTGRHAYNVLPIRITTTGCLNRAEKRRLHSIIKKPVILQGNSGTCHTISLCNLINAVAADDLASITDGHGLSTRQLILDFFNDPGRDYILDTFVCLIIDSISNPDFFTPGKIADILHGAFQAGRVDQTFEKMKSWGGLPTSDAESCIDETLSLLSSLKSEILNLIETKQVEYQVIESQLLAGSLGEIFRLKDREHKSAEAAKARKKISDCLKKYYIKTTHLTQEFCQLKYTAKYPEPIKSRAAREIEKIIIDKCIKALEKGPVILGGCGHAMTLAGYDKEADIFYLQDSSRSAKTLEISPKELLERNFQTIYALSQLKSMPKNDKSHWLPI